MSLQTKLAGMLIGMGVAVIAGLGTLLWSFVTLERETIRPFVSMTDTLRGLATVKRDVEELATLIAGPPMFDHAGSAHGNADGVRGRRAPLVEGELSAAQLDEIQHLGVRALHQIELVREEEAWRLRAGQFAFETLTDRLSSALDAAPDALASRDPEALAEIGHDLFQVHELIERIEGRILADARIASTFADQLRGRLVLVVGLATAAVVLTGVLGAAMTRRIVVRPVGELRSAAARIGKGDFEARLPVRGGDELGELAREFNEMTSLVGRMQDERVERERFAAIGEMTRRIVHNLRGPLSGIKGLAQVTMREVPNESVQETQGRIVEAVDGFDRWITELLNSTRPLSIDPIEHDVGAWLESVVSTVRPMADSQGITLELDLPLEPMVRRFDAGHLEHAVSALVTNALEATGAGGIVRIEAGAIGEGAWELAVVDSGPGIPPENRARIFDPAFTSKPRGTGTGLAVVRQVVEAHGGRIDVGDGVSQGSEGSQEARANPGAGFRLRLPGSITDR